MTYFRERGPEMLKFILDRLKTKNMCKHAVQKLPYTLVYVPDQYKTMENENGGTLKSVPDCCKNQEIRNKGVDNYPYALEFVPEC